MLLILVPIVNTINLNLEVNFTENKEGNNPWHCWVCNKKGKSIYLQLLRKAGASQDKIAEAKTYVKDVTYVLN